MDGSYWSKVLTRRVTRRRAVAVSAGSAAAAAFLAACGGSSNNNSSSTGSSTAATGASGSTAATGASGASGATGAKNPLLADIVDSTSKAVKGGTFLWPNSKEPGHFDGQAQGQVQLNHENGLVYEALVRNKPGIGKPSSWSEVEKGLADSWEVSPDKLTITFKIHPGIKWQNVAPVSGRAFDATDVAASWDRYVSLPGNNKAANANSVNPAAPVVSIKAPDASTVVVTLKEPSSYIMQRLANTITGEMGAIYPKEAAGGFDPKQSQIGTGPFMLDKFTPSVSVDYKRNPDYWDPSAGFLDEVKLPNIPEYAGQLAQFKTGALSSMAVSPEDIIQTKKDTPALAMYQVTPATNNPGAAMRFGWLPIGDKKSPFLDIRVRQALSMAFDRDTHIDTFSNVSKFAAAGLPINTYYNTAQGYVPGITLDPRDTKTFGENAKYFQYNLSEAKKLFDAAKSAYGSDFPEIPSGTVAAVFGAVYTQECAVMDQYAQDLGFKVASSSLDYNIDYLGKYVTKQGQLSGIFYGIGAVTSPDSTDYYVWKYYSKSGPTSGSLGFGGPDGSLGDKSGDPQVDALIEQAKGEFDSTKNAVILGNIQRALAKEMYQISRPGFADTFELAWPAIGNFATFQGESRVILIGTNGISQYWFDPTKPSKP